MKSITPCLWFDGQAEEATNFYTSTFPDSRILSIDRSPGDYPAGKAGDVLMTRFELLGKPYMALNGGPGVPYTNAVSFLVECESQQEVDHLWSLILDTGGSEIQCGWINDKYGLPWQVIPMEMMEYIGGPDPDGAARAYSAMMDMIKIDVDAIRRAYEGA
jgi:predicted 3-demethylubiquinone-9 3-methyltransferase (glyoxalase superfamily)